MRFLGGLREKEGDIISLPLLIVLTRLHKPLKKIQLYPFVKELVGQPAIE